MPTTAFPVRFLTRSSALAASLLLSGCALHRTDRALTDLEPVATGAAAEAVDSAPTTYIVESPSFSLIASSQAARDPALRALRTTSGSFTELFDQMPPRIDVVVVDTTLGARSDEIPSPAPGLSAVLVLGGGLTGPGARQAAATLTETARFETAVAWLNAYAAAWSVSLEKEGVQFRTPDGDPIAYTHRLPDWLQLGVLRTLTAPALIASAVASGPLTLHDLFAYRLTSLEAKSFTSALRDPASRATRGRDLRIADQAASLLRYLQRTQGPDAVSDILGASLAGLDMNEILRRMAYPTTLESLEHDWLASVSAPRGTDGLAAAGGAR